VHDLLKHCLWYAGLGIRAFHERKRNPHGEPGKGFTPSMSKCDSRPGGIRGGRGHLVLLAPLSPLLAPACLSLTGLTEPRWVVKQPPWGARGPALWRPGKAGKIGA
jgi:hypothetical protein